MVKKASNDIAMEAALQAAVTRMGNGTSAPGAASVPAMDPIGLLMTALPKLLESKANPEDLQERLDESLKEELAPIRQQLAAQSQLLEQIFRAQKVLLRELRAVQAVQSAVGGAMSNLTHQMARIEIIDDPPSNDGYYPAGPPDLSEFGFDAGALRPKARPLPRKR
jgi:hypothetical protein